MAAHIPYHFSSKLDFMNTDFRSVSLFRETNQTSLHFGHDVISYLEQATPIHYSLFAIGFGFIILSTILCICVCYLKIPHHLIKFLCCQDTCWLKKRVNTRLGQLGIIQRVEQANTRNNQNHDVLENRQFIADYPPSCPAPSHPIIRPIPVPMQSMNHVHQPYNTAFICPNNIHGCYCAHPANPSQCQITTNC